MRADRPPEAGVLTKQSAKGGDFNVEVSFNHSRCDRAWGCSVAVTNARRAGECTVRSPHVLVVEYDIVPAEIDKYLTAIKELGAAAVKEPGCRQLSIAVSQKDANHLLLFEVWDNAAALDAFFATDGFKKYQATTANMISKRDIRAFSSVAINMKGI